jgi:hypothetical protein
VKAGSAAAPYTLISVQVRCTCTEYAGQLIDNYMVNPNWADLGRLGGIWKTANVEAT